MPGNILIVEDDEDLALGLAIRLQSVGYRVTRSGDAVAALLAAKRQEPDLVVLDLGLPAGGGLTFLQRLRALTNLPYIPVIVVTAAGAAKQAEALAAGAQAAFEKPVDNDTLLAAINNFAPLPT